MVMWRNPHFFYFKNMNSENQNYRIVRPRGGGFIKIHRDLMFDQIFDDPLMLKVFLWCILKASHKEHHIKFNDRLIHLIEGQFITGRKKAADFLGISEAQYRRIMAKLSNRGSIKISANNKFSVITIKNWQKYQRDWHSYEYQIDEIANEQPAN